MSRLVIDTNRPYMLYRKCSLVQSYFIGPEVILGSHATRDTSLQLHRAAVEL